MCQLLMLLQFSLPDTRHQEQVAENLLIIIYSSLPVCKCKVQWQLAANEQK